MPAKGTCEDRVCNALYGWLIAKKGCHVISCHPPSGKSYSTDLIRIPRRASGIFSRERHHVDVVVAIQNEHLLLIELKCALSESADDIQKLREIRDSYAVSELVELIQRRSTIGVDLSGVKGLVLGLGFENHDSDNAPDDFVTFCTATAPPVITVGTKLPADVQRLF